MNEPLKPDRGAKALAERLYYEDPEATGNPRTVNTITRATAILGETGLFIADVTKHEPGIELDRALHPFLTCLCGWMYHGRESYFDHIGVSDE